MPRLEGAQATRQILDSLPDTRVLVLTTYADDEFLIPALQAGARGYLTKDATAEEIEHAIRVLIAGHTHLDAAVQQRLVTAVLQQTPPTPPTPAGEPAPASGANLPDELTPREIEVLKLIAAGLSNNEIADKLVLSNATVKTHINRIFYKTGTCDRAQAVRYAYQRPGINRSERSSWRTPGRRHPGFPIPPRYEPSRSHRHFPGFAPTRATSLRLCERQPSGTADWT